jgi:NADPH:quinone reductase-like Zn-dependent oxidoreductase
MRAIVITRDGGPEVLQVQEVPRPRADLQHVVVRVRAFGINHAEGYVRAGIWPHLARIPGIECAGEVHESLDPKLPPGRRVVAIMGGMGRTIDGSYAEYVRVPSTHVVPIDTRLPWEELAALPESYATAWMCLFDQLRIARRQTLLVRGGTSALGQAAVQLARDAGITVLATTRSEQRFPLLVSLGAEPLLERDGLSAEVKRRLPRGVDAVLELVGSSTLVDSLACTAMRGRLCMAGFLGGLGPVNGFDPLTQMPSGVATSLFASFHLGTPEFPVDAIPLQEIVERAETGALRARPVRVFGFGEIPEAHALMERSAAGGKMVVRVD